jgi:hypothetical protein
MIRLKDIDLTPPTYNKKRTHNWKPTTGCFRDSATNSKVWLDDGKHEGMVYHAILDGGASSSMPELDVQ